MTAESLGRSLDARRVGATLMGKCPAHQDGTASLAIRDEGGKVLLHCHAGCEQRDVLEALKARGLWESGEKTSGNTETAYNYTDADGKVLYQVVRQPGKRFFQRRPNGEPGKWANGLAGVAPVPYRLPDLLKAETIFCVEGEKDADNLARAGLVATCNNGGAGNFKPALAQYFAGKNVVILPDNDGPGRKHAEAVAGLLRPVAASVLIVELPGLPEKGDVSDYLASGKTQADIRALCREALAATPKTAGPPKIRSVSEVCSIRTYAAQKIEWVIDEVLAAGTVNLISGDAGSGKTTLATDMASRVERGIPFAGLATEQRPVLFLDRENPLPVVIDRFDRLSINDSPNFKYWGGWAAEEAPAPWSPIVIAWVQSCARPPLIVVDSLVGFLQGEENSATEVRAYMQGFRRLADLGSCVVVLHHSGKGESSKDYRGSSDIKASIDCGFHLSNLGESSRLGALRLRAFKARFSVQPELILHYEDGGFRMDCRGPSLTMTDVLRELLIENPRSTASEFEALAATKSIGNHKARQFLANGIDAGVIRPEKGPHNTKHHVWKGSTRVENVEFDGPE